MRKLGSAGELAWRNKPPMTPVLPSGATSFGARARGPQPNCASLAQPTQMLRSTAASHKEPNPWTRVDAAGQSASKSAPFNRASSSEGASPTTVRDLVLMSCRTTPQAQRPVQCPEDWRTISSHAVCKRHDLQPSFLTYGSCDTVPFWRKLT